MTLRSNRLKGSVPAELGWARVCYAVDSLGPAPILVRAERGRSEIQWDDVSSDLSRVREELRDGIPLVACLSVRESLTRWLDVPLGSLKKAEKVLPALLDIQLPFHLEDCVYDFLNVERSGENTSRALAVAARRTDVEKRLEVLRGQDLDPMLLDQEGLALWTQSVEEIPPVALKPHAVRAVVFLNGDQSCLVQGRGESYASCHAVRGDDPAQLGRLLRASQTDSDGDKLEVNWIWTGPGAEQAGVVDQLKDALAKDWPGLSIGHKQPTTFLARALATRALAAGPMRCNLRADKFVHPVVLKKTYSKTARRALAYLAAGLVLCAVSLGVQGLAEAKVSAAEHTFTAMRDKLLGYSTFSGKGKQALAAVEAKLAKDNASLRPFTDATDLSLVQTIGVILKTSQESGLKLETLSLDRDQVALNGSAQNWNGCDRLTAYLRSRGRPVVLNRKDALGNGRIPFSLRTEPTNGK